MLNIINYILFTVYCISDNIYEYTSDNPENIILGSKYKYRLLNYIKNINDNSPNITSVIPTPTIPTVSSDATAGTKPPTKPPAAIPKSVIKEYYDTNSSDLYIHKTIIYYNYIVKLLMGIMLIIVVMLLYNIYTIGILAITNCDDSPDADTCGFLLSEILANDGYVYYIIVVIFLYIYAHSYLYTYFFNKNIYAELYDIYAGEEGTAGVAGEDGKNKYKTTDTIVSNSINHIHTKTIDTKYTDTSTKISLFLTDLYKMSFDTLDIKKNFDTQDLSADNASGDDAILLIINEGILNNNKFIIPTKLEKIGDINVLLKHIYNAPLEADAARQTLLGHQIFIYLIYNYVITNSIEDPFIIHKLNNVYLDLFNNLYNKYNKDTGASPAVIAAGDPNILIDNFKYDIRNMYKDIRRAFTVKLLLPVGTEKIKVQQKLHENADLILKYIRMVKVKPIDDLIARNGRNKVTTPASTEAEKSRFENLDKYKEVVATATNPYNVLITTIKDNIDGFANGFSDYYQEDKTLAVVNRVVYKINFYLAIEMMVTIIYILLVLLLLYKSGKYPYMETQINTAITYAIIIINELVSAILGIV
jgi:PKD repeat protein